jgi:hypothetical protein
MADGDIFDIIWKFAPPDFQGRIPAPGQATWNTVGQMITSANYEAEFNYVYGQLINVIALQKVLTNEISNPLKRFHTGQLPMGQTVEEIVSDVIVSQEFQIAEQDQFAKWVNTVKAAYHNPNSKRYYPITREETEIRYAFKTEGGLTALANSIHNQMYNSSNLDEFILTKQMLRDYLYQTDFPLQPSQVLDVPDPRTPSTLDRDRMMYLIQVIKGVVKSMSFPSTKFNPTGLTQQVQPSNFVLFLDSAITVVDEVSTLTKIFNPQYAEIDIPIVELDNFGTPATDTDKIIGIIADKRWLMIYDILRTARRADNARNLYINYYYHVHQLYATSPFYPVVYITGTP